MRLIDADRLMDSLRGNVLIDVTPKLEKAITEQPTAFDREKVIDDLGRCRIYQFQGMLPDGRVCHFSDMIEIVKKGGIE